MGQGSSNPIFVTDQTMLSRLVFIQNDSIPHLGELPVYRLNQKPYDYYLMYRETYPLTSNTQKHLAQLQQFYTSLQGQRNIVKVELTRIETMNDLCSKAAVIDVYARYHNYTLENAIKCKAKQQKLFRDGDLLYLLDSLAAAAHKLDQAGLQHYLGMFKDNKVYLSTEGFLKLYPFRVYSSPHGSQISLASTSQEPSEIQPSDLFKEKDQSCYRTGISDLMDLGFLAAQVCLLQSRDQLQKLSRECVRFRLERTLTGKVSVGLRGVILRLLEGEQFDWQGLRRELELVKHQEGLKMSYCIRLEEDISLRTSEMILVQREQDSSHKAARQLMLSSVHFNLVPDKIEPLSRRPRLP